jgi:hypothetical protein
MPHRLKGFKGTFQGFLRATPLHQTQNDYVVHHSVKATLEVVGGDAAWFAKLPYVVQNEHLIQGLNDGCFPLSAALLFRGNGVVALSVCHDFSSNELIVVIELWLHKSNDTQFLDQEVAGCCPKQASYSEPE